MRASHSLHPELGTWQKVPYSLTTNGHSAFMVGAFSAGTCSGSGTGLDDPSSSAPSLFKMQRYVYAEQRRPSSTGQAPEWNVSLRTRGHQPVPYSEPWQIITCNALGCTPKDLILHNQSVYNLQEERGMLAFAAAITVSETKLLQVVRSLMQAFMHVDTVACNCIPMAMELSREGACACGYPSYYFAIPSLLVLQGASHGNSVILKCLFTAALRLLLSWLRKRC